MLSIADRESKSSRKIVKQLIRENKSSRNAKGKIFELAKISPREN